MTLELSARLIITTITITSIGFSCRSRWVLQLPKQTRRQTAVSENKKGRRESGSRSATSTRRCPRNMLQSVQHGQRRLGAGLRTQPRGHGAVPVAAGRELRRQRRPPRCRFSTGQTCAEIRWLNGFSLVATFEGNSPAMSRAIQQWRRTLRLISLGPASERWQSYAPDAILRLGRQRVFIDQPAQKREAAN